MENTIPEDFSSPSADQVARFLMICAKEDPALTRRPGLTPADTSFARISEIPAILRQRSPADMLGRDTYLEELATLVVTAVQQAEDAARQAVEASNRARRGKFAWGAVGALGFAVGIAGCALGYSEGMRPALGPLEMRVADGSGPEGSARPRPALFTVNRPPELPVVTVSATVSDPPAKSDLVQPPALQVPVPTVDPEALHAALTIPDVARPPIRLAYRPRLVPVRAARRRPAPFAKFVALVQRDIHNIFR